MVYFNQVTGWDGSTAVTLPGTFTDAVIAGNGTYSVSVDGLDFSKFDDFSDQDFLNLLFVDTDIPLIPGQLQFQMYIVFLMAQTSIHLMKHSLIRMRRTISMFFAAIFGMMILQKGQLFYYSVPMKKIEVTFDVSGFNYDYGSAPAASTTDTASTDTLQRQALFL